MPSFEQLQWLGRAGYAGKQMTTAWWTVDAGGAAHGIATQVGCTPAGDLIAYSLGPPPAGTNPPVDPTICACLTFGNSVNGKTTNVVIPAASTWFQSDGETVNPFDPAVAAVIAALLAGGLCFPDGTTATGYVRGYLVKTHPTPWPS